MSVPKQKKAKSRVRVRQHKQRLNRKNLSICPQCKKPVLPHHACSFCGTYKNKKIINITPKEKKNKKEKTEKTEKQ